MEGDTLEPDDKYLINMKRNGIVWNHTEIIDEIKPDKWSSVEEAQ